MVTVEKNVDGLYDLYAENVQWLYDLSYEELLALRDNINDHVARKLNEDLLELMDGADDCEGGACKI